jgi:hypothetical protein
MHVFEWLIATNPKAKNVNREESAKLIKLRTRVCLKAKTTPHILINAKARDAIGIDLISRMIKATRNEELKITLTAHGIEES